MIGNHSFDDGDVRRKRGDEIEEEVDSVREAV